MGGRGIAVDELSGSLCCTLLDRRSSVPLNGARVTCVGHDNRVTSFNADRFGQFAASMPQGAYDLVISARGYLSLLVRGVGILGGYRQLITRALVPGRGEDLEGEPSTALGGYITDRLGLAVGNVTIHINAEQGDLAYTTRTDRNGAYLISGLIPQKYSVTVSATERRLAREIVPVANAKDFIRLDLRLMQS